MRFTVDTNILVYALDRQNPEKRSTAHDILSRGRHLNMFLTAQVLGEFVNAVRRKNPQVLEEALELVEIWRTLFPVGWTSTEHIALGGRLATRHRLQFWDSVIVEIARSESAGILLTEDMQDGKTIDGVTILNPFAVDNEAALRRLLTA